MKDIYSISIAVLLLLTTSCKKETEPVMEAHSAKNENSVELSEAQLRQTSIEIGSAVKKNMGSEIRVNGMIDVPPQGNISVTIPYGGFLKYTDMLPGTKIRKGQIVARVENPDFIEFQRDYLEAISNNDYLKSDYDRQKILNDERVSSTKVFEKAKSMYLNNQATIKALESKLRLIGINPSSVKNGTISSTVNVYSPIDGVVRDVYVNTGKYFGTQDVLMDITDASDLHVELNVFEDDIPLIRLGQRIRFRLANAPEQWMEAKVFLIGNSVRDDRSVTIHGHLKESETYEDILPGMFVNAKIEVGTTQMYAVPEEAIVRYQGKHYLFEVLGNRQEGTETMVDYEMLEVEKGTSEDGFVAVTLKDKSRNIESMELVLKDAFTLLATAKNSEEEGGGHGH